MRRGLLICTTMSSHIKGTYTRRLCKKIPRQSLSINIHFICSDITHVMSSLFHSTKFYTCTCSLLFCVLAKLTSITLSPTWVAPRFSRSHCCNSGINSTVTYSLYNTTLIRSNSEQSKYLIPLVREISAS